jgi:microsomal dipeptidase-like Zn-dependent dipeptidase
VLGPQAVPTVISAALRPSIRAPYRVSPRARELHASLRVVDLHADSLLWGRDLARRSSSGHVDLPRLADGNVALQVFAAATRFSFPPRLRDNDGGRDLIGALAVAAGWPRPTWRSPLARALLVADRARRLESTPDRRFVVIRSGADLAAHLDARRTDATRTAGLLAIEGAWPLEGDVANVDHLAAAGFRVFGLAHFGDNPFAGSAHGVERHGLTRAGRDLVRRLEAASLLVDVAHASPSTIEDVADLATRPVIASHTGVTGTCASVRNLTDDQLRAIASTGGLVGIGFWPTATCGRDAVAVARAIVHAAGVIGPQHVALGSDFDGATGIPFDASGVGLVTDGLLASGLAERDVRGVMGENALALFAAALPAEAMS